MNSFQYLDWVPSFFSKNSGYQDHNDIVRWICLFCSVFLITYALKNYDYWKFLTLQLKLLWHDEKKILRIQFFINEKFWLGYKLIKDS